VSHFSSSSSSGHGQHGAGGGSGGNSSCTPQVSFFFLRTNLFFLGAGTAGGVVERGCAAGGCSSFG